MSVSATALHHVFSNRLEFADSRHHHCLIKSSGSLPSSHLAQTSPSVAVPRGGLTAFAAAPSRISQARNVRGEGVAKSLQPTSFSWRGRRSGVARASTEEGAKPSGDVTQGAEISSKEVAEKEGQGPPLLTILAGLSVMAVVGYLLFTVARALVLFVLQFSGN